MPDSKWFGVRKRVNHDAFLTGSTHSFLPEYSPLVGESLFCLMRTCQVGLPFRVSVPLSRLVD